MADSPPDESPRSSSNTDSSATVITAGSSTVRSIKNTVADSQPNTSQSHGKMVQGAPGSAHSPTTKELTNHSSGDGTASRRLSTTKSVTFAEPDHQLDSVSGARDQVTSSYPCLVRGRGFTSDIGITRCLEISNLDVHEIFDVLATSGIKIEAMMQKVGDCIVLYLDDARDTESVIENLSQAFPNSRCTFVHPQTIAPVLDLTKLPLALSVYNGQLVVTAEWVGHHEPVNIHEMFSKCFNMVNSYGAVHHFALLARSGNIAQFRVELCSLTSVDQLLKSTGVGCQHLLPPHVKIIVEFYHPNGPCSNPPCSPNQSNGAVPADSQHSGSTVQRALSHGAPDSRARSSGRTSHALPQFYGGSGNITSIPENSVVENNHALITMHPHLPHNNERMLPDLLDHGRGFNMRAHSNGAGRRGRPQLGNSSHLAQSVDIAAIENGLDVRTTLMLRNLPNRLTYYDVKDMLFRTSKGVVDFLYLRIDFASGLNVGYGFVNFISPEYIVPFLKANEGRPWPGYDPKKALEISYATIQGQECLIQKFRNSSVLRECEAYTPKIFYTIADKIPEGKQIGDDYKFPPPDNLQKLNRSLDNARTIGLYSTKDSRSNRDARRPRSQFDRGTPRAVHDEAIAAARSGARGRGSDAVGIIGGGANNQRNRLTEHMSRRCDYGPIGPPPTYAQHVLDPRVPVFYPDPYTAFYQSQAPPHSTNPGSPEAAASEGGDSTGRGSFPPTPDSRTHYRW